jgi:hypothetical protein
MIVDSDCSFETIFWYQRRNHVDYWRVVFLFIVITIELPVGNGVIDFYN